MALVYTFQGVENDETGTTVVSNAESISFWDYHVSAGPPEAMKMSTTGKILQTMNS